MIQIIGTIFVAALGLSFGSFLNVCLSRWPAEESVVQPRSHCSHCSHTLSWWENVPLLSWLVLRGRCRECRTWIGWRYPLVELAVAVLWVTACWSFFRTLTDTDAPVTSMYSLAAVAVGQLIFYWLLVALAVLDAENFWLPNWLTLPGVAVGFILAMLRFKFTSDVVLNFYGAMPIQGRFLFRSALHWLFGIFVAAGIILLIRWVYWLIRHEEGMGLGDAKLMAMLAAWLGLPQTLFAFGVGVTLGAGAALILLALPKLRREEGGWALQKLPLGTFLCVGGVVSSLWGKRCLDVYLRWAGF